MLYLNSYGKIKIILLISVYTFFNKKKDDAGCFLDPTEVPLPKKQEFLNSKTYLGPGAQYGILVLYH
jgi:hypothetical protein